LGIITVNFIFVDTDMFILLCSLSTG